ncbi:hypothetical protein MNBD_DELTA01-362 [hydrothermal vent metagenome]|uniref:Flagellar assembly factor FliW n=1 Tax=hydrothermal vent metagenome TaxID=652676 RepID=A0A3B0RM25_9ZZZZ
MNLTANEPKPIKLETSRFGEIEVTEDKVILFNHGIPGFEGSKRYILIDHDDGGMFKWLQAVDDPQVAFLMTDPCLFKQDYKVSISRPELKSLDAEDLSTIVTLVTVCVEPENNLMALNLKGPIVFNSANKTGKQLIVDKEDYSCRFEVTLRKPEPASPEKAASEKTASEKTK